MAENVATNFLSNHSIFVTLMYFYVYLAKSWYICMINLLGDDVTGKYFPSLLILTSFEAEHVALQSVKVASPLVNADIIPQTCSLGRAHICSFWHPIDQPCIFIPLCSLWYVAPKQRALLYPHVWFIHLPSIIWLPTPLHVRHWRGFAKNIQQLLQYNLLKKYQNWYS